MPTKIIPFRIPPYIVAGVDKARGDKTRTAWVIEAIQEKLRKNQIQSFN